MLLSFSTYVQTFLSKPNFCTMQLVKFVQWFVLMCKLVLEKFHTLMIELLGFQDLIKRFKTVKDIPGPFTLPIFGTTLTSSALVQFNLFKANEERLRRYGPIVKEEHLWGFPMIHILKADHIESVCRKAGNFRPGMEMLITYRTQNKDCYDSVGLANEQGEQWKRLHSITSPLLNGFEAKRFMETEIDHIAKDFVDLLRSQGPVVENFQALSLRYVTESAFFNMFGSRMDFITSDGTIPDKMKSFLKSNDRLWSALHESTYRFPWCKYFPSETWRQYKEAEDNLLQIVDELIQDYSKRKNKEGMLQAILDSPDISYKTKRLITLEVIQGASDSVNCTIAFLLYWISRDSRVAKKLYEELRTYIPNRKDSLDVQHLYQLSYLNACIMESYRMCPIAPCTMRLLESPLKIEEYHIPANTLVILQWHFAVLQDENFYKAKEFLPERWLYEDGLPPYQPHKRNLMFPFGLGKRACPGSFIAKTVITVLVARLFRNFKTTVQGNIEPKYDWIVQPNNPMRVYFVERDE